jgi:hypothetical protein
MDETTTSCIPSHAESGAATDISGSPPAHSARPGYVAAIVVQAAMLWVANHLLEWGWPSFLTSSFEQVLPWIAASIIVSMAVNACFIVWDRGWFRALGDTATATMGVAVGVVTWDVFPFDFSGWGTDWTWLVRLVVAVGIVGSAISVLVNGTRFVWRLGNHS